MKKEKKIKIKGEGKKGRKGKKGEKVPENAGIADAPCEKKEEFVPLTGALLLLYLLQVTFKNGTLTPVSEWASDDKRAFQSLLHFELIRLSSRTNDFKVEEKNQCIDDFQLTEKGKVYLFEGLLKVPFPVLKWEIPTPISI